MQPELGKRFVCTSTQSSTCSAPPPSPPSIGGEHSRRPFLWDSRIAELIEGLCLQLGGREQEHSWVAAVERQQLVGSQEQLRGPPGQGWPVVEQRYVQQFAGSGEQLRGRPLAGNGTTIGQGQRDDASSVQHTGAKGSFPLLNI